MSKIHRVYLKNWKFWSVKIFPSLLRIKFLLVFLLKFAWQVYSGKCVHTVQKCAKIELAKFFYLAKILKEQNCSIIRFRTSIHICRRDLIINLGMLELSCRYQTYDSCKCYVRFRKLGKSYFGGVVYVIATIIFVPSDFRASLLRLL